MRRRYSWSGGGGGSTSSPNVGPKHSGPTGRGGGMMEGGEGMMEGELSVRVDEAFLPDALLIKIDGDFFGGPGAGGVTPPEVLSWSCRSVPPPGWSRHGVVLPSRVFLP